MKPVFYFITLLLLFSTATVSGQMGPLVPQLKLPQIAPASPDAAAIERFGNFPVTYSTGVPNISIPLWTIQCGSLSWPLALSYHASGIKVDQSASMVGLGWNLDGPAVITRIINGRPDEETIPVEPPDFENVTDNDYDYLYKVNKGLSDGELDLFNFSFNGRSGKFVIPHNDAVNVLQIPQSNLKITHDASLNVFTIKDEMGIVYTFDQKEITTITSAGPSTVVNTTSWYLSKVELPDKNNTIEFTYEGAGPAADTYFTYTQVLGNKYQQSVGGGQPDLVPISQNISPSSSGVSINLLKLTGITFPNGSIVLNYDLNPREDLGGGNNVYNKLKSIVINEKTEGFDTVVLVAPVKTFHFNQSYFNYRPTGWADVAATYRLRLDNVVETGSLIGPDFKEYTFQYNLAANMSPRGSNGQDNWGFNNGITSNQSLMQSENVTFYDGTTTISTTVGDADRSVNAAQMKAWMLTSITYPTGGKTEFDYEPHQYATDLTLSSPINFGVSVIGNQAQPLEQTSTFTYTGNIVPGTTRLSFSMSRIDFTGVTQRSVVVLRDLTLSQDVFLLSQDRPLERITYDQPINLIGGHQYQLKATLYYSGAPQSLLDASIGVRWSESSTAPDIRSGGGLRIKQMLHYSNNSTVVGKEIFVYDTAVTLTPFNLINQRYKDVNYRLGIASGLGCAYWPSPVCRVYNSQSVYALSNALGSPMLYRRVEKINVDPATGTPSGKSEFVYDVFQDQTIPVGGPLALGAQWSNGFLTSETHYKYSAGNYVMVQKKENQYNYYNSGYTRSLRVEPKVIIEFCSKQESASTVDEDLRYYTVHVPTGSKRLSRQIVTDVDEFQHNLVTTTINYYGSPDYDYPTAVVVVDGKNNRDSVTYKRSPDLAQTGNVYNKMELQNMLQPVIEQVTFKNAVKLNTLKNNYRDWFGNSKVIALDTVQASLYTNPLETRLRYYGYDTYGNLLSMSKDKDNMSSFIWAYNKTRPIAQVVNASSSSIAYTSFETSETGGWSGIVGAGLTLSGSITGLRAFTKNSFNISKSGLSNTTSYTISYWSKNGAYSVNSTTGTAGRTVNGWTFYSHTVTPTTGTISVTGSGSIDELRLFPSGVGQMTTYTYNPLTGVTSMSDVNNRITYYEYDELQRPILIRDQDRNILKKFAYNYFNASEYLNIHYNTLQPVSRYKTGCTGCQIGSYVTYTVPANTYLSTQGPTQANARALDEAYANAQTYADIMGTCSAPGSSVMTGNNQVTNNAFSVKFHNNCTGTDYTRTLNPNANITLSPAIPVGTYTVTITKMFGPGSYTYKVNGQLLFTSSDPVFSNVTVLSSGNQGVIIQL
ncbi:MAG: hypothetical protein JNK79_17000 [Chitinophagaceae bacterium]|nr:hypothetical protein [Chitinophagaceae bacterium]